MTKASVCVVRETVDEHISWASGVAAAVLPPDDQHDIQHLCAVIAERNADRPLAVGVFGQFSSGKSTLLNALLGAGLLPSAARVTTSVATRLWSAESDRLTVKLSDSNSCLEFGTNEFDRWYESICGSRPPADVRIALREIMRSPRAACELDGIDIMLAGSVMGPGVVVIDTPGFDATDSGHREVAEQVAAEVDLAIVLIPANDPGSMSLARFLHEVLADLSDRCVFVLTKFRQVPEAERAELQEHVVSWLQEQGFAEPTVLRADMTDIAVAVGDGGLAAATDGISPADAIAETGRIAAGLSALAADRRQRLIETTLEVLLSSMLARVTRCVDERRATLEELRERLSRIQITELTSFLAQWEADLNVNVQRSAQHAVTRARSAAGPWSALSAARSRAADDVGSGSDIRDVVAELLSRTEDILGDWIAELLREAVDSAGEDLAAQATRLRATFIAQYAKLAELTGADPQPPPFEQSLPSVATPEIELYDVFEPLRELGQRLQSTANWKSGGGAALGAIAGTAIFPVVGTFIGAGLGLLAGSGRTKQKEQLLSAAEEMQDEGVAAARDAIRGCEAGVRVVLTDALDELLARYEATAGPVITQLTADYHVMVAGLDADLRAVTEALSQARLRRDSLAAHGLRERS